jgi:hypothetical protein
MKKGKKKNRKRKIVALIRSAIGEELRYSLRIKSLARGESISYFGKRDGNIASLEVDDDSLTTLKSCRLTLSGVSVRRGVLLLQIAFT